MPLTPADVKRIYSVVHSSPKYLDWWKGRQTELAKLRRRLKRVVRARGPQALIRFIKWQFAEKPIQTLDSRHLKQVLARPQKLKESVSRLLDDTAPIETRFSELLTGDSPFRIRGLGKGTISEWLMIADPERYGIWNAKSRAGLCRLGLMPTFPRGASWGSRYRSVLDSLGETRAILDAKDFSEVDLFLHFIGEPEEEGDRAWKQVTGGPMPRVRRETIRGFVVTRNESPPFLSERGYRRSTRAQSVAVERLHNSLSNRMRHWLGRRAHANAIDQERARTDLRCVFGHENYLFELKIISDLEGPTAGHHELRDAIGQLLDYSFYSDGRARYDRLAIVTDSEPKRNDLHWIKGLSAHIPAVEVFWFGEGLREPTVAGFAQSPIGRLARKDSLVGKRLD